MHKRNPVLRKGLPLVEIVYTKEDDGTLTFAAVFAEDCPEGQKGTPALEPPSYSECAAACPVGYELYRVAGLWKARSGH